MAMTSRAVALACFVACALCCTPSSVSVNFAGDPALPASPGAYQLADVQAHFDNQPQVSYFRHNSSSFHCVDSRSETQFLRTPGGDLVELSMAIEVYLRQTSQTATESLLSTIFDRFMSEVVTPERAFYYHTADSNLRLMFADMAPSLSGGRVPTVFPTTTSPEQAVWEAFLVQSKYQGCGHIRLMLDNPAAYGLTSNFLPSTMIKLFFRWWWARPNYSTEKGKIYFSVKLCGLAGAAVAIVSNSGPACSGYSPAAFANIGASTLFVYHGSALLDSRRNIADWFARSFPGVDPITMGSAINALGGVQLNATLTLLSPANSVRLYTVAFSTIGSAAMISSPIWQCVGLLALMALAV